MGVTTAVAHGGNPQDRAASPRPRCIADGEQSLDRRSRYANAITGRTSA
ncbi:MAG: hypothetical protein F6K26_25455 [Moorea sp. SIO2I5]|nr:hypothetical protein [Moorena sp. SIO2I5]